MPHHHEKIGAQGLGAIPPGWAAMRGFINFKPSSLCRTSAQLCVLALGLWLAPLSLRAQTESGSLMGEKGHLIKPASTAPTGSPEKVKSTPAGENHNVAPVNGNTFPAFPLQPPAALAEPTPTFPAFPVQTPTDLAGQQSAQSPAGTAATEPSPRVKELLNEGYQALKSLNYPTAIASFRQATELDPQNSKIWFEYAYALAYNKQLTEAIVALQKVVQLEPNSVAARSQLGYLFIQLDRVRDAIETFLAAELLEPQNYPFKLQLGYLYDRAHDKNKARIKFIQASQSPEIDIHQKAIEALKALAPVVFARNWIWANEIYAAPTYYRRFNNLIAPFIWRSGIIISERTGLEGYFSLRATHDTRSSGGHAPQIFEDNTVITSVGMRARPLRNALTVYAEAGLAFNLLPNKLATVRVRNDFRLGAYYSRQWGKRTPSDKLYFPFNPVGELYFDVSYYNRFRHNVIGYLQAREGLRLLQAQQTSLEAYGRLNIIKDTGHDFFNNLTEAGVGLGFVPKQKWGVKLTAEALRGYYFGLNRPGERNPYAPQFNDFRVALIYGKYLVKE